MRKLFLAFVSLLALHVGCLAADAPLAKKAKTQSPLATTATCSTNQCTIWFGGLGLFGAGSNADILGQGLDNSIFANGGMVAADVGAQFWNNGMFLGAENIAGWAFGTGSNVGTASANVTGGIDVFWVEAGGSLGDLFGSGATPVSLDNALTSDLISLYFGTGPGVAFGGNSSLGTASFWTSGAGARYLIPNGNYPMLLDFKYVYGNNNQVSGSVANKNFQFVGATFMVPFNW